MSYTVYLIHFDRKYHHAEHYIGCTSDLDNWLSQHANGQGGRLLKVIGQAEITWHMTRIWECNQKSSAIRLEKKLKSWKKSNQFCPDCNPSSAMNCAIYNELDTVLSSDF